MNFSSRVFNVPAPTPVTTPDRCYVPHCFWFRSCASLTSFIIKASSNPSLDLFPRKCTYVKVMDLCNMVLWTIGFIANRYRISPHQISLCPLLTSDMNESQLWSLPSLNFLSADLTWLDMYVLILAFAVAKHDTTSSNDAFDFSIFWTCSIKAATNYCKCLNVLNRNSLREFPKQRFRTAVGLSMDMKYECEAGYNWSILGKLR